MNKIQKVRIPKKVVAIKSHKVEYKAYTSKTDKHNKEVQKKNVDFTTRLEQIADHNQYEESAESWTSVKTPGGTYRRSYVFSSDDGSGKHGEMIVMNIDLGP